jgi:hypothetical protein
MVQKSFNPQTPMRGTSSLNTASQPNLREQLPDARESLNIEFLSPDARD